MCLSVWSREAEVSVYAHVCVCGGGGGGGGERYTTVSFIVKPIHSTIWYSS